MEVCSDLAPVQEEDSLPGGSNDDNVAGEDLFKCDRCGVNSDSQATLLLHKNSCTGISFSCPRAPACQRRFIDRSILLIHLRQAHGTDPNLPPQIKKLINQDNSKNKIKFKCSKCGAKKSTKEAIETHEKYCSKIPGAKKYWTCPVDQCGKIFKKEVEVNSHLKKKHKDLMTPSSFDCQTCGASFKKRAYLTQHQKENIKCKMMRGLWREDDKVSCDICGRIYPTQGHMEQHKMRVHEKERFGKKCEFCEIICETQTALDRHLWSKHKIGEAVVGEKPKKGYVEKCGVEGCEVVMRGPKWREDHMRRMHGERERRWKCELCGKRYLVKSGVQQHWKKEHSDREPPEEWVEMVGEGGRGHSSSGSM